MLDILRRWELYLFALIQIIYNIILINLFLLHFLSIPTMVLSIILLFLFSTYVVRILDSTLKGWSKANQDELFREDNKLLSGVTLSQAVTLLFIDRFKVIPENIYIYVIIEIVLTTIFFYISRTYAHIKNDSEWRLRSIRILTLIVSSDLSYGAVFIINKYLPTLDVIYVNVTALLVIIVVVPIYLVINNLFESRYACTPN